MNFLLALHDAEAQQETRLWDELTIKHARATMDQIKDEIHRNGMERVLNNGALCDIAAKKVDIYHQKFPGAPKARAAVPFSMATLVDEDVDATDTMALLCYTATDIQGDLRWCMLQKNYTKWPLLSVKIRIAVAKLGRHATELGTGPVMYHGLHGIQLGDMQKYMVEHTIGDLVLQECSITYPAPVSCSRSREVAIKFACGLGGTAPPKFKYGILLEVVNPKLGWQSHMRADVHTFISKFPYEEEVVFAPFKMFHVPSQTPKSKVINGCTLQILQMYM